MYCINAIYSIIVQDYSMTVTAVVLELIVPGYTVRENHGPEPGGF